MSLYIADPRNAEAVALLSKYHGMRPCLQSINGPVGGTLWAVGSAVLAFFLFLDSHVGWAVACVLSALCGAVWAMFEYEPDRRRHMQKFDELVTNGQIVCVSTEVEKVIYKRLEKNNLRHSVEEMLAYCYVDLFAFQSDVNEVRAQGSLDKAGERYLAGKIREFISQCVTVYRQHLAEEKTRVATEQGMRTDWAKKRL